MTRTTNLGTLFLMLGFLFLVGLAALLLMSGAIGGGTVIGLLYLAILASVIYALFVVWPAPVCLTGGLLLLAASVFGLYTVARWPARAIGQSVELVEQRYGATMVLALLFAMFSVGVAFWLVCQ